MRSGRRKGYATGTGRKGKREGDWGERVSIEQQKNRKSTLKVYIRQQDVFLKRRR